MASNKIDAATAVSLEDAQGDPRLPLDEIQGDILVGLTKTAEVFSFFHIADIGAFKHALHSLAKSGITSVAQVQADDKKIKAAKDTASRGGKKPKRLKIRHANIAFSASGVDKLAPGSSSQMPNEFRAGASAAAARLHDPVSNGLPSSWETGFDEAQQDGVLIVTGESLEAAREAVAAIIQTFGGGYHEVHRHIGEVRPDEHRGQEHFGFEDGISQPGIRGLTARENPNDPDQGVPGQDLLWPGEFIFGRPAQPLAGSDITLRGDDRQPPIPWMKDGAFMVFRKLEQHVPEFRAFLDTSSASLGLDSQVLGARLVGRWESGAPLVKVPLQDDELMATDRLRNNAFEYGEDPQQRRCPYAAHIRKAYPRDDTGDEVNVQLHRLRRAGIPYGPEVDGSQEQNTTTPGRERGLSFVAYMTSFVDQFEFVQTNWANNENFVFGKTRPDGTGTVTPGIDPIIGQPAVGGSITVDEPVPNYVGGNRRTSVTLPGSFIVPRAAGYYFSPSIPALRNVLSV
jgi:Dyp-type peroxidase family